MEPISGFCLPLKRNSGRSAVSRFAAGFLFPSRWMLMFDKAARFVWRNCLILYLVAKDLYCTNFSSLGNKSLISTVNHGYVLNPYWPVHMKGVLVISVEFRLFSILLEIDRKDFNEMMKLESVWFSLNLFLSGQYTVLLSEKYVVLSTGNTIVFYFIFHTSNCTSLPNGLWRGKLLLLTFVCFYKLKFFNHNTSPVLSYCVPEWFDYEKSKFHTSKRTKAAWLVHFYTYRCNWRSFSECECSI